MKIKKSVIISFLLVFSFVFGGCSQAENNNSNIESTSSNISVNPLPEESFSEENILNTAKEGILSSESYNAEMEVYFDFDSNGSEMNAEVTTDILSFSNPVFKHITMNVQQNGSGSGKSDFYVDTLENGDMYLYVLYGDKWYKTLVDNTSLFGILGQYDIKEVLNILLTNSNLTSISNDIEEINGIKAYKVDCVIPSDKVPETIINTGVFVVNGMIYLTEEHLKGAEEMPITYYVDSVTGNIIKFLFDAGPAYQTISDNMFSMVEGQEGFEDAQKLVINAFNVDVDISNINSAEKIEIPKEVLSAEEMDDLTVEEQ